MEVKDLIRYYDDVLPLTAICTLIKWCNKAHFNQARITGANKGAETVNQKIRDTKNIDLRPNNESLTNVHWANLIASTELNYISRYAQDLQLSDFFIKGITDLQILKYEKGGFYNWHIDHAGEVIPRSISCIMFLNNDYRGGDLMFRDPQGKNEMSVIPKPGRLVIWPSCFMYPHTVKPVEEGIRYTVVSWAV